MTLIPPQLLSSGVRIALIFGAVAALSAFSLYVGYRWGSRALPEAALKQQIDFTRTLAKRWELNEQFTVVYVDRVKTVQAETAVLIREVPRYVKDTCRLSPNLRLFHDAATKGKLPPAQRDHAHTTSGADGTSG